MNGTKERDDIVDKSLADAASVTYFDLELRASHAQGLNPVAYDVGTPVINIGDVTFFGPVVTPAPKGEGAGKLFDAVLGAVRFPGFYEIKRSRIDGPSFE